MADKDKIKERKGELLEKEEVKLKRPRMYKVILINDDYTPQEFVVYILVKVFHKNGQEGQRIMLEAHTKGRAIIGTYTHDVAKTKVIQVVKLAEQHEHPLQCIIEVEEGPES